MATKFVFCFYLFVMATIKKELGAGGEEGGALFKERVRRNCPYARFDLGVDGVHTFNGLLCEQRLLFWDIN